MISIKIGGIEYRYKNLKAARADARLTQQKPYTATLRIGATNRAVKAHKHGTQYRIII